MAYELARLGARVGLLDVDIYGPSLPTLIHPDDPTVRRSPIGRGMVEPIVYEGVRVLSLGFVSPEVRESLSVSERAVLDRAETHHPSFSFAERCTRKWPRRWSSSHARAHGRSCGDTIVGSY